jgi:hypothetical protein
MVGMMDSFIVVWKKEGQTQNEMGEPKWGMAT